MTLKQAFYKPAFFDFDVATAQQDSTMIIKIIENKQKRQKVLFGKFDEVVSTIGIKTTKNTEKQHLLQNGYKAVTRFSCALCIKRGGLDCLTACRQHCIMGKVK